MFLEETVDRKSQEKLYVQIHSILRGKIEKGEWASGEQIPTETELCKTYDVSKATVRIAIAELVRSGFLQRWQGKGTFVSNVKPNLGMAIKTRLTEDIFGEGVNAEKEILVKGVRSPKEDISSVFGTEDDIYYILCKRTVDKEPACVDESFMPLGLLPGIHEEDFRNTSFYDLIQKKAVKKVDKVVQNIELAYVKGEPADLLGLRHGSPVLLLHRLLLCSDGSPIAYTRLYGSGKKYRIQTEFERIK